MTVPLYNAAAEQAVLGAIFCNNRVFARVAEIIKPEDFGNALHSRIFAVTAQLIAAGNTANPITLKGLFDGDRTLANGGGAAQYLAVLATAGASVLHPEDYAQVIGDLALRRELVSACEDDAAAACNFNLDRPAELLFREHTERVAKIFESRGSHQVGQLICQAALPHAISTIPPRPWAYGRFLLFGSAAAIGAVDGGGKGAIATVVALSIITGHPLLGEHVWRKGAVAIVTYEDDEDEWRRRIAAACLHYGPKYRFTYEDVIGSFYFVSRPGSRVYFAALAGRDVIFPDGDDIIKQLKAIGAVLLIIDPLNHAHTLDDGNNNVLIAKLASEITRIAKISGVAALVLHHLRKGATGDPDDLMGATSLRATFRSCQILARMTMKEAEALKVPCRQAWRYSRISGNKDNYAPPPDHAKWYCLESVALGNPNELYTEGDNIQVTTTWTPPSAFEGISLGQVADIFAKLRIAPGEALRWSPDRRSDEWVGQPIIEVTGIDEEAVPRIVTAWVENGVLIEGQYKHPNKRHNRKCVRLNEAKAVEILGPLYQRPKNE